MAKQVRVKNVVAAIVHDSAMRFLVCYNRRCNQYAFPMKSTKPGDNREEVAVWALKDHCPAPVAAATSRPLEYVGGFGTSWSTGEDTYYNYHVYEVQVPEAVGWPAGQVGSWCGFLEYEQLQAAPLISWSTKEISRALMEGQKVALAVIRRNGPSGKEFLLIENARYHGYFFSLARVKTETEPVECVLEAVQSDTGYLGRIGATYCTDVETTHFSPRYNRNRTYRFYVYCITFPDVDLNSPTNAVEKAAQSNGVNYGWFAEEQLANPAAHGLSPTVAELGPHVLQACP